MQFRNGAYLFKPDLNHQPPILPIIDPIDNLKEVVIISGHVFSEISLIYEAGTSVTIQGLIFNIFSPHAFTKNEFPNHKILVYLFIPCFLSMFGSVPKGIFVQAPEFSGEVRLETTQMA